MAAAEIDWRSVRRVLVVRLRSIGDTVLSTPSLIALRRFLPSAEIDILLEDWVAPVLDGLDDVAGVVTVGGDRSKTQVARGIRRRMYDVVFNLHGGTTATFFTFATGAAHRVGYGNYQYSFLHNHRYSSSAEFWGREHTHSAEQQLALLGFTGVPVDDRPKTRLVVTTGSIASLDEKLTKQTGIKLADLGRFAVFHPAAAYDTKEWASANFARVAEFLARDAIQVVAVAAGNEQQVLENVRAQSTVPIHAFNDLTLPEITALSSRAEIFVGNDSGIAHIAAAVNTPSVVIFGSSNRNHWRPWTDAPNEVVFESFACQPCPGHECKQFGEPRCIQSVTIEAVTGAIARVMKTKKGQPS